MEYREIVDSGEYCQIEANQRLVFFAFFNCRFKAFQVFHLAEPLHPLGFKVSIGHGMANDTDLAFSVQKELGNAAGSGAFANTRPDCADTDHRFFRRDGSVSWSQEPKAGPGGQHCRCLVHHVHVGNVTVGEVDPVHAFPFDQWNQLRLFNYGDAVRVERAAEGMGVGAVCNVWNLGGGERNDPDQRVIAKDGIEIVEVAAGGSHDNYSGA